MNSSATGTQSRHPVIKHLLFGLVGVVLGGLFLWLAVRDISWADVGRVLAQMDYRWLCLGVGIYFLSVAVRCVRWGLLLRVKAAVKWRHVAEALVVGYAANYLLPGRIGELVRADYARRVFVMSRFLSLGTIVVERACDGLFLVCILWISLALTASAGTHFDRDTSWIFAAGAIGSAVFGALVVFIVVSRRIDLRTFGLPEALAKRWDFLIEGISSVMAGNLWLVAACTIVIWMLEALALANIIRSFGVTLTTPQTLVLLGAASLSTLIPTAPGYLGTFQFVFGKIFPLFGHPETVGLVAATAIQIYCYGTVTLIGGLVLLSRSGILVWRARFGAS